jgi:hypothetical protein
MATTSSLLDQIARQTQRMTFGGNKPKGSNQSLEPTAGRCTERLKEEL